MTDSQTRLLGLIGTPVEHSLSPVLHSAAIENTKLNAVYLAFNVEPARFGRAVSGLWDAGIVGANVTRPFKMDAMQIAEETTEVAKIVGAANTLYRLENGGIGADNSDIHGATRTLIDQCKMRPGDTVEIIGAGGAARAVAVAAGRAGARVAVRAREEDAAKEVANLAREVGGAAPKEYAPSRIVVNATPLGQNGERLPTDLMGLGRGRVAFDLIYAVKTPFLEEAERSGAIVVDGAHMLVAQAIQSFARWTGLEPDAEAIQNRLREVTRT